MAQFARPDSDVTVNSWTPTPLFEEINEASASDLDFIGGDNNTNDLCEVGLSNVTDPESSSGHTFRYRYRKDLSAGNTRNIQIDLVQGTTVIATRSHSNIPGVTFQAGALLLSGAEADSITDYTDLRLRFTASGDTGGSPAGRRSVQVSWAELEVPDPPAATPVSLDATAGSTATISTVVTFVKTLSATEVASPSVSTVSTFLKTLSATAVASPVISRTLTLFRTLSASAVSVASFVKKTFKTLSATAVSNPSIDAGLLFTVAMQATAVGVGLISKSLTLLKSLSSTMVGVASIMTNVIPAGGSFVQNVKGIWKKWYRSFSE